MGFYFSLPLIFLRFWFIEAPVSIIAYFASLNKAFLQVFSLSLLVKTYFKPWKNEYREGLVAFSIGMGMFIKTFVILVDLLLFIALFLVEVALFLAFILLPIGVILSIINL
jgi:hypothetical protein